MMIQMFEVILVKLFYMYEIKEIVFYIIMMIFQGHAFLILNNSSL